MTDNDDHDAWLAASRSLLTDARGDAGRVKEATRQLCMSAFDEMFFSPMIVWDYLVVSTPGLFGETGYTDGEVDALMPMLERVMQATWASRVAD